MTRSAISLTAVAAVGVGVLGLAGCAGGRVAAGGMRVQSSAPEWVTKGAAAMPKEDQAKLLYGVGVSAKSPNPTAMRERAEHRARVDLSRQVKTYVSALTKDYMRDYPDYFTKEAAGSDEYTERVSKEVSEATLRGAEVVDRWQAEDGVFYALARMPRDQVDAQYREQLRAMKGLLLEAKANEALSQLDAELKKVDLRDQAQRDKYLGPSQPAKP